jgi:hypothetical protein
LYITQSHDHTVVEDGTSSCTIDADILDLFACLPDKAYIEQFFQSTKSNKRASSLSNPVQSTACIEQTVLVEKENPVPANEMQSVMALSQTPFSNIQHAVISSHHHSCDEEFEEFDLNLQFDEIICQLQEGDPNDRDHT